MLYIPITSFLILLSLVLFKLPIISNYFYLALLFLPLLDPRWSLPKILTKKKNELLIFFALLSASFALLIIYPNHINYFFSMLIFTALPEEWFFRAYLLSRFGLKKWHSNILTSIAFTLLHLAAQQTLFSLLVFFPSLVFGLLYIKTKNIFLVTLLHALFNLIFVSLIKNNLIV